MSDPVADPLNTDSSPPSAPSVPRRGCTCEYCECKLAPSGEVLSMGEKAKGFRKHEEIIEKKDAEIQRLTSELAEMTRERDALRSSTRTVDRSHVEIRR